MMRSRREAHPSRRPRPAPRRGLLHVTREGTVRAGRRVRPGGGAARQAPGSDLGEALAAGRLTDVRFDGGNPRQAQSLWSRVVGGMGDTKPRVSVGKETQPDWGPATARLSYAWPLPGTSTPWTYQTTALLTQGPNDAWRVRLGPSLVHPDLRPGERLEVRTLFAKRADILGAGGRHLVTERPVLRFGIGKAQVAPPRQASSGRSLAKLVGVDPAPFVAQVRSAGAKAFVEAIVLRTPDGQRVLRAAGEIPGAGVLRDTLPLAPTREFARPLLGTVGPVTAEVVQRSGGIYGAGDEAGLSGLEQRYDERLRGGVGHVVDAVDGQGRRRTLLPVRPRPARRLATTRH